MMNDTPPLDLDTRSATPGLSLSQGHAGPAVYPRLLGRVQLRNHLRGDDWVTQLINWTPPH